MNNAVWKKIKELDWSYLLAYLNAIIAILKMMMGSDVMGIITYLLLAVFWILCSICCRIHDFMEVMTEEVDDEPNV